jgi:hypothetical protein
MYDKFDEKFCFLKLVQDRDQLQDLDDMLMDLA